MTYYNLERSTGYMWNVVSQDGKVVLADESYTMASAVEFALNNPPKYPTTEAEEVASNILARCGD